MADLDSLQIDAVAWHRDKFPDATIEDVMLKLTEEIGEIAGALDRYKYARSQEKIAYWSQKLDEEMGDATVCLLVLQGRFRGDWLSEVARDKFRKVKSRKEGHKEGELD